MIKPLAPVLVLVAVLGGTATSTSALTSDSVDLFYGTFHTLPVLNVRSAEGGGCTALAEPFHTGSAWNHSTVYSAHLYSGPACDGVVHAVLAPGEDTSFAPEFEVGSILFATASPAPTDPPATVSPAPADPSATVSPAPADPSATVSPAPADPPATGTARPSVPSPRP